MSEVSDRLVGVEHAESHSRAFELEYVDELLLLIHIIRLVHQLKSAWFPDNILYSLILIPEGMSANYDRFGPGGNQPRNVTNDYGFPKHSPFQNVSNSPIW